MKEKECDSSNAVETESDAAAQQVLTFSLDRIRQIAQDLRKKKGRIPGNKLSPLVPIKAQGTKPPLFLVHPVGGGVQLYYHLAEYLDMEQPLYGLQNHDSDCRQESAYVSIEEMARNYIQAIKTVCPNGPYMLGGWSMGGIVAYEMALQLNALGDDLGPVVMVDTPARFESTTQEATAESRLANHLVLLGKIMARNEKKHLQLSPNELEHADEEEQIRRFQRALRIQEIGPPHTDAAVWRAAVKTFLNNYRACRAYLPRPYAGKIVLMRATEVMPEKIESAGLAFNDPTYGWQPFCTEPITVHWVPGDHILMMSEPNINSLSKLLQHHLDECGH
ncbi:MAG TPA: thioesterase domain-containing protein [Candidatus Angelobacter sp.]|nr:thioesterase domain-containing protein [Candidatus Angelobacter sp.]